MTRWAARVALAAVALTATVWPAIGQDAPKSILPPGFDEPPAAAPPPPSKAAAPTPPDTGAAAVPEAAAGSAVVTTTGPTGLPPAVPVRSTGQVGWLSMAAGGYGQGTFAGTTGPMLISLLNRLDTPLAARWGHIVLRRALLSTVPTPAGVRPADWVAARAWALVRMGEVDGARTIIGQVPLDQYTQRLYGVAAQVNFAAADLPALCPLAPNARSFSREPGWQLIDAVCAGIDGDDITSSAIFDRLRESRAAKSFDIGLAERVVAAANGGGRAANVEWQDAGRLTAYRFGLAAAAGVMPPPELLARAKPQVRAWLVRTPTAPGELRLAMLPTAGALGVSSSAEMVKAYAAHADSLDAAGLDASLPGRLRAAYVGRRPQDRLTAMKTLWARGSNADERYGMKVLTARAATLFPVSAESISAAPDLVESMLAAGHVRKAMRWWPVAESADDPAALRVWAMLAAVDPSGAVPLDRSWFDDWHDAEIERLGEVRANRRAQLFAAALAGLGRDGDWLDVADDLGSPPLDNLWTRRLGAAAAAGRVGEVAVLAATGMQTGWSNLPPQHLAHIVAAYRRVGRGLEARLLAAEALARG